MLFADRHDLDDWLRFAAYLKTTEPAHYDQWLRDCPMPDVLRFTYRCDAVMYRRARRNAARGHTETANDAAWHCAPLRDRSPLHWRTGPTYTARS